MKVGEGLLMASAGARTYKEGVWGPSPERDSGTEPLVRGQGAKASGAAESLLAFEHSTRVTKFAVHTVSRKVYFFHLIAIQPRVGENVKLPITAGNVDARML